jgi:hypothetical protein
VKSLTTGFTLCVLATCSTLAAAADDVSFGTGGYASALRTKEMMEKMDTNGDHMVSKDEWTKFQNRAFDGMDKDKSGYLTEAEWVGQVNENHAFATAAYARGLMTDAMFKQIDANGDGKISREEFLVYHRKIWEMLDKNKKGMVGLVDFIRPGGD